MAAWKKLANQPEWVRKNKELLKKLDNQPDNVIDKVAEYYEKSIPSNTPSGFNGPGVYGQVEFNEFGHPQLLPHVSDPNHIVTINMKGNYSSDMTDAKNALQAKLAQNEKIVKHNPNGGWSPFYIEKNGNSEGLYTWHHHQDGSSMYPVKKDIHDSIAGKHTGGKEIVTKYPDLIGFFNQP
jgi:predicted heme/steroid binding protein